MKKDRMRLFSKKDGRTFFQDLHKIKAEIEIFFDSMTDKSSISAKYHIVTDSHEIGSIYINFKPSDELVSLIEKEIDEAVSKINQKDKPENFI